MQRGLCYIRRHRERNGLLNWKPSFALVIGALFVSFQLASASEPGNCLPIVSALSPMAKTAELANIAQAESRQIADQYFGRDGFLNSRAYAWAVAEIFYDSDRTTSSAAAYLPTGKVYKKELSRMYDAEIKKEPRLAAEAILGLMLQNFDNTSLTSARTPGEANAAVEQLARLIKRTGLTQTEIQVAFEQMNAIKSNPELRSRLTEVMVKSLPEHSSILLRDRHARDLARRALRVPLGGWYQLSTGLTGAFSFLFGMVQYLEEGASGPSFAGLVGAATALPMVSSQVVLATRAVMAKFSAGTRRLMSRGRYGVDSTVDLTTLANVTVLPTPRLALPLTLSPPSIRHEAYTSQARAIEALENTLAEGEFGIPRRYGMAVQQETVKLAKAVLKSQRDAGSRELWSEIESHIEAIYKKLAKRRNVTRGEAFTALADPLMRKLGDLEAFFGENDKLRNDARKLREVAAKAVAASKAERSRTLQAVENAPSDGTEASTLERRALALADRVQSLEQTELNLARLLTSLDVTEDALAVDKNVVESMSHVLVASNHTTTDVNQALDKADLATLEALRAAVKLKVTGTGAR